MSKKLFIAVLLVFALLMAACQPAAPATTAPEEEPMEEEPMEEEPMEEEPMEEEPMEEEPMEEEPMEEEPMMGEIDCMGVEEGAELTIFYQWSGVEEENILSILQPLVDACGIVLAPTATRDQAYLDTQVQAGTPPDIAFFNVTQLEQYQDSLVPPAEL
jgi:alpha-glucoside transport system substrate-binding protein